MNWELRITKMSNGYVLKEIVDREENKEGVIQEQNTHDNKGEMEAMKELLCLVKDTFGVFNSKHDMYRLDVEVKEQK